MATQCPTSLDPRQQGEGLVETLEDLASSSARPNSSRNLAPSSNLSIIL